MKTVFPNISIVLNQDLNLSLQGEFEAMTSHTQVTIILF